LGAPQKGNASKSQAGEQAATVIFALPTELPGPASRAGIEPATEVSVAYATGQGGFAKLRAPKTTPGNMREESERTAPRSGRRRVSWPCFSWQEVTLLCRHRRDLPIGPKLQTRLSPARRVTTRRDERRHKPANSSDVRPEGTSGNRRLLVYQTMNLVPSPLGKSPMCMRFA